VGREALLGWSEVELGLDLVLLKSIFFNATLKFHISSFRAPKDMVQNV
jgi:hypothetical protein